MCDDGLDHTKFEMVTNLGQTVTFIKNTVCAITFLCNISQNASEQLVYSDLTVQISDSDQKCVPSDLKEKKMTDKRLIRVHFTPQKAGLFNLIIKYNNMHIKNSPFYFAVLDSGLNTPMPVKTEKPDAQTQAPSQLQNKATHRTVGEKLEQSLKNEATTASSVVPPITKSKVSVGRGRLLQLIERSKSNNKISSELNSASSLQTDSALFQKRKSPVLNEPTFTLNSVPNDEDMQMDLDDKDESMANLSRNMQRMVYVDESENQYHSYSHTSLNSQQSILEDMPMAGAGHAQTWVMQKIENNRHKMIVISGS